MTIAVFMLFCEKIIKKNYFFGITSGTYVSVAQRGIKASFQNSIKSKKSYMLHKILTELMIDGHFINRMIEIQANAK